jgi:DNA helicase-2/ATP-dependent DNA helicase PcrA
MTDRDGIERKESMNDRETSAMPFLRHLTESQKKAVLHKDGPLLVLAGPGSGKTRVITCRIAALIGAGVDPRQICAITFTNKAAEEMRRRVETMGFTHSVHVSTFHSLCVRVLRRYGESVGIRANFSIYDEGDQTRCVKEAIAAVDLSSSQFAPGKVLAAISQCKNDIETPDELAERAGGYFEQCLAKIYRQYQKSLAGKNALDFDDLLLHTACLLRDREEVRGELNRRFRYLLVDEYQDTNHSQYQIAKGLALEHRNICVTGDPDQSIYRWRGADIGNILAFEKDWPEAVVVRLEENFRSRPQILAAADRLIVNNTQRKAKKLIAVREGGKDLRLVPCADETAEAALIAERIAGLIREGGKPGQVAVFYRINAMSRPIEEQLIRSRIPYQVVRGVEFYGRKEIRDMLGYLRLLANPDDDLAFLRAVNSHPRGIGQTTLDRLGACAQRQRQSLWSAAKQVGSLEGIPRAAQAKIAAFAAKIDPLRAEVAGPVAPLMEKVLETSGYEAHLRQMGDKEEGAMENIDELISAAALYDKQAESPSLVDYLQSIALYSDTDAFDPAAGKVSLMTLHAAKGLEFEHVFMAGLEEGILPHERCLQSKEEMEEERRLCFVGVTRAKDELTLTLAKHRTLRGQFLRTIPSPFLFEMGFTTRDMGTVQDWNDSEEDEDESPEAFSQVADEPQKQPRFRINELVQHSTFGLGRVKEFVDLGEDSIVVVKFNSGQLKSLMTRYAKLQKMP